MTIVLNFLFEVYNVCVGQKFSEFLINFFFAWTLTTLATSRGHSFNLSNLNVFAKYLNFYMRLCLLL